MVSPDHYEASRPVAHFCGAYAPWLKLSDGPFFSSIFHDLFSAYRRSRSGQVASAHMSISTSCSPWVAKGCTGTNGIRAYDPTSTSGVTNADANRAKCGTAGFGNVMALASPTRLAVDAGATVGGNINVLFYHGPPNANITFSMMSGSNPDFSTGPALAWPGVWSSSTW